jgi:hypothetical protein
MKKLSLSLGLLLAASTAFGQVKLTALATIGQTITSDNATGISQLDLSFNTSVATSTITATGAAAPAAAFTFVLGKGTTNKGMQVNVYNDAATPAAVACNDFKCNNFGAAGNPIHVASVASLKEILTGYEANATAAGTTATNTNDLPAHCLFDKSTSDQAFGAYPGKYKKVEYGFYFSFASLKVNSDITFDIDTYYEGANLNGATASYELTVYVGGTAAANLKKTIADFYVTGSGKKTVSLAQVADLTANDFTNQKVYFFLKTVGTATAVASGTIDPIIVFDNFAVNYTKPLWIMPAAGSLADQRLNNQASPFVGVKDQTATTSMVLQTQGRLGVFNITNDRADYNTRQITFLATGGIKSKDGEGNYTVDVPYTFTAGTSSVKDKMVIAAPVSGSVNDDIMIFFDIKPNSTTAAANSLEFDCGTRIWFDFYSQGQVADKVTKTALDGKMFVTNGKLYVETSKNEDVVVRNITGQTVGSFSASKASGGIALAKGIYLVSAGNGTSKVVVK